MALKTFVKIGNISNLSDARYCAGMMVDVLGFNLQPESVDYMSPEGFAEISNWLSGVKFAGEFGDLDFESLKHILPSYNIDIVEVTSALTLLALGEIDQQKVFRLNINTEGDIASLESTLEAVEKHCDWISIFCENANLYQKLGLMINQHPDIKFVKGYNIDPSSIADLAPAWMGIALEGSPEDQPGYKDYGIVMDVLEALEEE